MGESIDRYNVDELEAPDWLNAQFFTKVLCNHEQAKSSELTINRLQISPASVKGDHYASIMFRADIDYSIKNKKIAKSIIIKTMPEEEGQKKDFLGESHIFETEIAMYTELLPNFEAILRGVGDHTKLFTSCIYHSLQPKPVIIFDDLVAEGYNVVRDRNANLEELRVALSKLAKWQAVSLKVLSEEPTLLEKFQYDVSTLPNFVNQKFITGGLPNFIDLLGRVESLKKYQEYFKQLEDTLINRWLKILREYRENPQEGTFYVLSHGDFHLRNIMFKNNQTSGILEDCMLLDFQLCHVGLITTDLLYATYLLFSASERRHHRDELIYHYFQVFSETLRKIGYTGKAPTLLELRQQFFENKDFEFMILAVFLPALLAIRKGTMDPGELMGNEERRREMYYDKDFIAELECLLPQLLHLGYFEQL